MLHVLCTTTELDEDGVVIVVGEVVSRLAVPNSGTFYATALDDSPYWFDHYALGSPDPDAVLITGRVVAIDAIYTTLETRDGHGFHPAPGSARLESVASTADSRIPPSRIVWGELSEPDENGFAYGGGYADLRPGDEDFNGWRFTLDARSVTVDPPT